MEKIGKGMNRKSCQSAAFIYSLILFLLFLTVSAGCGGGGGGDNSSNSSIDSLEIKSLFTAPDPEDSLLSRIEFEPDNAEGIQAIEIYQSTDNSDSERITTQIYVAGESKPYMFFHDDMGRVERIDAPDGTGVKLDYTDSTILFSYITPDKQIGTGSVPIEGELKELLDKLANYDTSTSDVWISDTKSVSMDDGNDIGDIIIQSDEYPFRYSLGMWAAVTLVNNTEDLRGIPVDGANISCPNTNGYSCHLITVRDGGLHEEPNGTFYRNSFVEIVVRKEFIITKDDVFDLRNDCHTQNAKSRARISNAGLAAGVVSLAATVCAVANPPATALGFWGLVGTTATVAGVGLSKVESGIEPDCNQYADRQAAFQMIPDEELEIIITPYSHVYDIVSDPIKIQVTPSCMEYGVNCRDYYEYKEYSFTGTVNIDVNRALIACDVCSSDFIEPNAYLELPASTPETTAFQTLNEEVGSTSLYWAAPGDEKTCGGDAPIDTCDNFPIIAIGATGGYYYVKHWLYPMPDTSYCYTDTEIEYYLNNNDYYVKEDEARGFCTICPDGFAIGNYEGTDTCISCPDETDYIDGCCR